tara:strand:- start:153 stop:293 length:141 start_codon:yes stop_codon:yes gene_type:complete
MSEENILIKMNEMCEESLSPDIYAKWLEVELWLRKNRKKLKPLANS